MFSFFATIAGVAWIGSHIKEILIVLAVIIFLIIFSRHRKKQAVINAQRASQEEARRAADKARREQEERDRKAAEVARSRESTPSSASSEKDVTINIPSEIDGNQIAYHYDDVQIDPAGSISDNAFAKKLIFSEDGDRVCLLLDGIKVGYLPQNRLAGMARDWLASGDPYLAYLSERKGDKIIAFLAFYTDAIARFLKKHPDAKLLKLTGKPDEFAFYSKGQKCEIEKDFESDKLNHPIYPESSLNRRELCQSQTAEIASDG